MANRLDLYKQQAGMFDVNNADNSNVGVMAIKQDRLARAYANKKKKLEEKSNIPDDADSSDYWRLLGGDSPEVFHDITPTGDTKNERSKVYKQYAYLNGVSIEEAVREVDQQAEAYKADQAYRNSDQFKIDKANALAINPNDAYYGAKNLSDSVAEFRKRGMMTNNDGLFGSKKNADYTSYDIYNAGDKAFEYAKKEAKDNPGSSLYDSDKFLTGEKGNFGRALADNKEYVDRQISNGMMIPGANDITEYNRQMMLYNDAKEKGLGNFNKNSNVDPKIMDAIQETGYAKWAEANMVEGHYTGSNPVNQLWNGVKAVPASFLKSTIGMVDGLGEITGLYDLDDKRIEKNVNNLFQYDDSFAQRSQARAKAYLGSVYDEYKKTGNISWENVGKGVFEFAKDPSQWGNSFGYMLSFLVGGGAIKAGLKAGTLGAKVASVVGKMERIEKSTKYSKAAKYMLKTKSLAKSGAGPSAAYLASMETPVLLAAAHTVTQQEEEFKKNNGGKGWSPLKKVQEFLYAAVMTKADVATDVNLAGAAKYGIKPIYNLAKKGAVGEAAKGAALAGSEFALDSAAEGAVEVGQNVQQVHAQEVGSSKYKDQNIVDRMSDRGNAVDAMVAGAGGIGGSFQFKAARMAKEGSVAGLKKIAGKLGVDLNKRKQNKDDVGKSESDIRRDSVRGKEPKDYTDEDHYNRLDGELAGHYEQSQSSIDGVANVLESANAEGRDLTPEEISVADKTVERSKTAFMNSYGKALNYLSKKELDAQDRGDARALEKVKNAQQRLQSQANKLIRVKAVVAGIKKQSTVPDADIEKLLKDNEPMTEESVSKILRSHFVPSDEEINKILKEVESSDDKEISPEIKKEIQTRLQMQKYAQEKNDQKSVIKEKLFGSIDKVGLLDYVNIMNSPNIDEGTKAITIMAGRHFLKTQEEKISAYKQAKQNIMDTITSAAGENGNEADQAKVAEWAKSAETNAKNSNTGYGIPSGAYFGFDNKEVKVYMRKANTGENGTYFDSVVYTDENGQDYTIGSIDGQINKMQDEQNKIASKFEKIGIIGSQEDPTQNPTPSGSETTIKSPHDMTESELQDRINEVKALGEKETDESKKEELRAELKNLNNARREAYTSLGSDEQSDSVLMNDILKNHQDRLDTIKEYEGNAEHTDEETLYYNNAVEKEEQYSQFLNKKEPKVKLKKDSKSLLIPVEKQDTTPIKKYLDDNGFKEKDENHITALGFNEGKDLKAIFESKETKGHEEDIQKLIDEADLSYEVKPGEIYKISINRGGKKEEAVIQLVSAPGIKKLVENINKELDTNFPIPFPHISLAIKNSKFGIGIANEEAFQKMDHEKIDLTKKEDPTNNDTGSSIKEDAAEMIRFYKAFKNTKNEPTEVFKLDSNPEIAIKEIQKIARGKPELAGLRKNLVTKIKGIYNVRKEKNTGKNNSGEKKAPKRVKRDGSRAEKARIEISEARQKLEEIKSRMQAIGVDTENAQSLDDRFAQLEKDIETYVDNHQKAKTGKRKLTNDIKKETEKLVQNQDVFREYDEIQQELYDAINKYKNVMYQHNEKVADEANMLPEERAIKKLDKKIKAMYQRIRKLDKDKVDISIGKHNKKVRQLLHAYVLQKHIEPLDPESPRTQLIEKLRIRRTAKNIGKEKERDSKQVADKNDEISVFQRELDKRIAEREKLRSEVAKTVNPGTALIEEDESNYADNKDQEARDFIEQKIKEQESSGEELTEEEKKLLDDIMNNQMQDHFCIS